MKNKLLKTRGEAKRFSKYGPRLMTMRIWKSEYNAARLLYRKELVTKHHNRQLKTQTT